MFEKDKGWIAFWKNEKIRLPVDITGKVIETAAGITVIDHCLHKFPKDEIAIEDKGKFYWMDGFVFNKKDIIENGRYSDWQNAFLKETETENFPAEFRGGFSGFIYEEGKITLFNDHMGEHAVYYYHQNGIMVCSTRVYYILELLKYNNINLEFNIKAAHYMLELGYMLDESTFAGEIKRVLPGQKVEIFKKGSEKTIQFYSLDNNHIKEDMTEDEAIELVDRYFRQAIKRSFDKDREYGYKHLVDLSGGLDSRMVCWVAHDMGYDEQVNITFCKSNYLDFQIAQKISKKLKHCFTYMALDDFEWFMDAEEMARKNNGASLYAGFTGGNRYLKLLDKEMFGLDHTGEVGDAIVGSFFKEPGEAKETVEQVEKTYGKKMHYDIDKDILQKYGNRELFLLNVRGLLCAQTSHFTVQTYFESCSPFLDVDFLNTVLCIPAYLRCGHYLYFRWIEKKYPDAAEFGWEKWKGMKPKMKNIGKEKYWKRIYSRYNRVRVKAGGEPQHMNPTNYWYKHSKETQQWAEDYFNNRIQLLKEYPELMEDVKVLFHSGSSLEKTQAITVLTWAEFVLG